MTDTADEILLAAVAAGDERLFAVLYERYSPRLLLYFTRMLGAEKAPDFVQEVFIKVIENAASLTPGSPFLTWCFSVAHNMCCNEYRHMSVRSTTVRLDMDVLVGRTGPGPDSNLDHQAFQAALHAELAQLDEQRRSTFLLRFQEGFALADIARIMGCSVGTVKSRLFYTVRRLADRLRIYDPCLDEDSRHD